MAYGWGCVLVVAHGHLNEARYEIMCFERGFGRARVNTNSYLDEVTYLR